MIEVIDKYFSHKFSPIPFPKYIYSILWRIIPGNINPSFLLHARQKFVNKIYIDKCP